MHIIRATRLTKILLFVCLLLLLALPVGAQNRDDAGYLAPLPQDMGASGLKLQLRKLKTTGRLMMVTAHPDDEDGGLLTREARGKGVQTLLLTLTRGEGGQNKVGSSLFDALGVLRTLELLASDRYYGVEQRFTRVADFGYSKTADETFQKWGGHDAPLQDIVRVIREFRPDVLIARFSGTERDGHGHHQASAILTKEAFRAAADPNRFPEQIKEGLRPWQAKKLYIGNVCGFRATTCADENYTVKLNTGEEDPVLGMSYVQFAIEGLRHQESQGLGDLSIPSGPRYAFYKLVDSVLPNTTDAKGHEKDLFDGIETTLPAQAELPDAGKIDPQTLKQVKEVADQIESTNGSVESLGKIIEELQELETELHDAKADGASPGDLLQELSEKEDQAYQALNLAVGLDFAVKVSPPKGPGSPPPAEADALTHVSPGQQFQIIASLRNPSKYWLWIANAELSPERWVLKSHADHTTIGPGETYYANFLVRVPPDAPLTRPYWHRDNPETQTVYEVNSRYQTLALPPRPIHVNVQYEIVDHKGLHSPAPDFLRKKKENHPQGFIASTPLVEFTDSRGSLQKSELAITPQFSVALEPGEQVLPLNNGRRISAKVGVDSNLKGAPAATLRLQVPDEWRAAPESIPAQLERRGERQDYDFNVAPANLQEARVQMRAVLDAGGAKFSDGYTLVTRQDLGSFYYVQPAVQRVSIVDVKVPKDLRIGYIMGAGDDIPTMLQQIGINVTLIPADKLASEDLAQFGTVILGVRAYDTQKELVSNNQRLLDFVSAGGTLIVQNNNSIGDFNSGHFTPYPAELSHERVSVEDAPVQILAPESPVFHYPNEISQNDFDGWVQERGLYFMSQWDDHFKPLLACHDPNEPDQKGGLLMATYGKGTYIYSGYAFFRQLPAGVPGAIRLFVNLISAGKVPAGN